MQVVGTPRPSSTVLDEVEDNGYFLRDEEQHGDTMGEQEDLAYQREYQQYSDRPRPHSSSLVVLGAEDEEDAAVETSAPISLTGSQPVLAKQYKIVTDLLAHSQQSGYYLVHGADGHLLPPHHHAKPSSNRAEAEELAQNERKQLEHELKLEQEEFALLQSWRAGKISAGAALLPSFDHRVRILSLIAGDSTTANVAVGKMEVRTLNFDIEGGGGAAAAAQRRLILHCQICEFAGMVEDAVFDALAKTSDAIIVKQGFSEHIHDGLIRASGRASSPSSSNGGNLVIILSKLFGKTPNEAKRLAKRLGGLYVKHTDSDMELAARTVLLRRLREMGAGGGAHEHHVAQLERQTRRLQRKSAGASTSCAAM